MNRITRTAFRFSFVSALLIACFAFVSPAMAEWDITYTITPAFGPPDEKLCSPNQSVKAEQTVTVTAKIRWNGVGPAPKKILVREVSAVSWSAEIHRPQDGIVKGDPPLLPSGQVGGTGSTGLDDPQTTLTPDPQTEFIKGATIRGSRITPIIFAGNVTVKNLPEVTLTAEATATSTATHTTGGAKASCLSYSVSIIEIHRDDLPLGGDNFYALPGQRINLKVSGADGNSTYAWTAAGAKFDSWDHTKSNNDQLKPVPAAEAVNRYTISAGSAATMKMARSEMSVAGSKLTASHLPLKV